MKKDQNLWGGRFIDAADPLFVDFNRSLSFDRRLLEVDIRASVAYAAALAKAGVLTPDESALIQEALHEISSQAQSDPNFPNSNDEDVHTFVERKLVEKIGDAGRKLHTGRSRNDQVATDLRLWLRDAIERLALSVKQLQQALLGLAEPNREAVLPGYTHLQRAQPILFSHWCLAYFEMLMRDRDRLTEIKRRVDVLPLGSAALAGTSVPIDRALLARELGFATVSNNSLDAVSDRDFCVEFVSACSLIMVHLSRLAEEVVLYSSLEFGFFELGDAVASGSSLMPQKKNPDSMELVRGKAGRVFGHNVSLLTVLKGLPLAYNKDMQEDKEAVFDSFDTTDACLQVAALVFRNVKLNRDRMRAAASKGYLNATELADYLAAKGVPFRTAHEIVGKIVLAAMEKEIELVDLPLDLMKTYSDKISEDVYQALTLERALQSKSATGGTAPAQVEKALAEARERLE